MGTWGIGIFEDDLTMDVKIISMKSGPKDSTLLKLQPKLSDYLRMF